MRSIAGSGIVDGRCRASDGVTRSACATAPSARSDPKETARAGSVLLRFKGKRGKGCLLHCWLVAPGVGGRDVSVLESRTCSEFPLVHPFATYLGGGSCPLLRSLAKMRY